MQKTKIEWCDYTANPLKFQAEGDKPRNLCVKISAGCANCYSETITKRFGGLPFTKGSMSKATPLLVEAELKKMLTFKPKPPFKNGRDRAAVFPFDMTDVFGEWVPDELIDKIFAVFALRPDVDWLVLTKRAERMRDYFRRTDYSDYLDEDIDTSGAVCYQLSDLVGELEFDGYRFTDEQRRIGGNCSNAADAEWRWPLPNVWLGVSVEDQARADERIPLLLETPAAVRFLSVEPLLGAVDLNLMDDYYGDPDVPGGARSCHSGRISLVIVSGESGNSGARPMHPDWARSIRDQCVAAGARFFFKQWGGWRPFTEAESRTPWGDLRFEWDVVKPDGKIGTTVNSARDAILARVGKKAAGRLLDGREWNEMPGIDAPKE